MLDRNKRIKSKPERFQNCKDKFDLVVTCEERVYDQVVEGENSHKMWLWLRNLKLCNHSAAMIPMSLTFYMFSHLCCSSDLNSREQETLQPVHVINVDIQDNHEEATLGAFLICELCQCVSVSHQHFPTTFTLAADSRHHVLTRASTSTPADRAHGRHGERNRGAPPRV